MSIFEELANSLIERTDPFRGMLVRPNDTHFGLALVTESVQWIRAALSTGRSLTPAGERFVAEAAAYLGYLAYLGFERRGLPMKLSASFEPGAESNHLALFVSRADNGGRQTYDQDFLHDMHAAILRPPRAFPSMKGKFFHLQSLSLPSVEYLYLLGVHFMVSPLSAGNWPEGDKPGGRDADFIIGRNLLIDDLHRDINVPVDHEAFRRLSNWVVWPPYGWDQNDGQRYNMMALVDQIAIQSIVPLDEGIAYLRALLCSQLFLLRNLAARTLMVLGQPPVAPAETRFYLNAMNASDAADATPAMLRFRWALEGKDPSTQPHERFVEETGSYWRRMLDQAPTDPWMQAPILRDPVYGELAAGHGDSGERREIIGSLRDAYPGDWHAEVAWGAALLESPRPGDRETGERILEKAAASSPGDPLAHLTLARWYQERADRPRAARLHADAVRMRPWDPHTIATAMRFLTDPMTAATSAADGDGGQSSRLM